MSPPGDAGWLRYPGDPSIGHRGRGRFARMAGAPPTQTGRRPIPAGHVRGRWGGSGNRLATFTTGGDASGEQAHAFCATNPYINGRFGTSSGGTIRLLGSSRIRSNNLAAFM
jgi:hypothetical protein